MKTVFSNKTHFKAPRGFTVIEVVIASGLLVILMAGILTVYVAGKRSWHSTSVQMQATRDAGIGMARMTFGFGGTNGSLREASGLSLLTNMNGVWSGGTYPPGANDPSHYVTQAVVRPHPSWRLVCTNFDGAITWYDYNRAASNIVFWPQPGQTATRELVANHVTFAKAVLTNSGVVLSLAVARRNGQFSATTTNTTFLRLRN